LSSPAAPEAAESPQKDDAGQSAQQILQATGIQGGLIVHLGCGDGRLTAALHRGNGFLIQGLDPDAENIEAAREHIRSLGLYGNVTVDQWTGRRLPYIDNLVNLVVAEDLGDVPMDEVMRVLAPRGVAYVQKGGRWTKTVKPWPVDIDEWTHFLHGPDNNAVARDRVVGPPSHLQWLADPIHLRSHEHLNSVSVLVSARGRIFYIIDEGATAAVVAPPKWRLVARDAFNGIMLWEREIGPWEGHFRLFRSGPPAISRRLVAVGDKVYVTLGYGKPAAALDAATGKAVRTYAATEGALEIVCEKENLFVVVGDIDMTPPTDPAKRYYPAPPPRHKGIVAVDAVSGQVLWKRRDEDTAALMPTNLAVADGKLFFQNTRQLVCLDAGTGKERWRADRPVYTKRLSWSAPTLVAQGGVVLSADGSTGGLNEKAPTGGPEVDWILSDTDIREHPQGDVVAFSAADGKRLWTGRSLQGFCNPGDLFVIDGKVWCGADVSTKQALLDVAVDLKTGEVVSRRPAGGMPVGGHTRCYRNKATEKFLIMGDVGVEFVDVNDWSWNANPWVRGTCQYGVMPSNGLLYVPPDSCACRPEMRLHGFSAMAPERPAETPDVAAGEQLELGPAYDRAQKSQFLTPNSQLHTLSDWPTYRHDAARSGRTAASAPFNLKPIWQTEVEGKLTSLTIAAGKVFVSRVDSHTVYAIDAETGEIAWSHTVGGPVDSPPTVFGRLVIFGCRDGRVYCLGADDGRLVWRFRAAPEDRSLIAMERLESAWPVNGSVLARRDKVWFAAGRSPYLDGGIRLYALEAVSGKVVVKQTIFARGSQEFHSSESPGGRDPSPSGLPDILSASEDTVYMRWMGFDESGKIVGVKPHLFSATGFLDDTWWHRTYWQYGTWMQGGFGGWPNAARRTPSGRIMAVDDDTLFCYGRSSYDSGNGGDVHAGHVGLVKQDYQDMGLVDPSQNPYRLYAATKPDPASARRGKGNAEIRWQTSVPMLVRAMLLADRTLFIAGPNAPSDNSGLEVLQSKQPGLLWAVAAADGKMLAECELAAAPMFDGMAAAGGRLYLTTVDGTVVCLGGRD
jgi:outer membrane protein assembly factor BamB